MSRHSALVNTLAVVMAHVLDFGFVIECVFRYLLSVVVEYPDLLLMFSLFVTNKEFVLCVLDTGKVDVRFSDLIASVLVDKLDTDA